MANSSVPVTVVASEDSDETGSSRLSRPPVERPQYRILVPIVRESITDGPRVDIDRLLQTARAIAEDNDGSVLLALLVSSTEEGVPEETTLEANRESVEQAKANVETLLEAISDRERQPVVRGFVCISERIDDGVHGAIGRYDADAVLLLRDTTLDDRRGLLGRSVIDQVLDRAPCSVFIERLATRGAKSALSVPSVENATVENVSVGKSVADIESVLLAVDGGPHTTVAAEGARAIAVASGARTDGICVLGSNPTHRERARARNALELAESVLAGTPEVTTTLVESEDAAAEIVARSEGYDAVVLGTAAREPLLEQFVFGSPADDRGFDPTTTVLTARRASGSEKSVYYRWAHAVEKGTSGTDPSPDHRPSD